MQASDRAAAVAVNAGETEASTAAPEGTRQRIVAAALRLFARQGLAVVSMRDVLDAAGQRNQSAIHYHFGGKDGLLEAVAAGIHEMFDPLVQEALGELEALERDGTLDRRSVVTALVAPMVALYHRDEQGRDAIRLMARLLTEHGEAGQAMIMREYAGFLGSIDERLARLLPGKPRDKLRLQILLTAGTHLFGLIALDTLRHSPFGGAPLYQGGHDLSVEHALDLSCMGLLGE